MQLSIQELAPGKRIDRYEIEAPLGAGAFGFVYRAKHTLLGHVVALKLLHPEHTESEELLARFFREAKAAAAIGSRHIAKVHDCGTSKEGWHFLAMELLEGQSLEMTLGSGYPRNPLGVDRTVTIALQILESLAVAHGVGIIHRDLKPANIFLTRDLDTGEELVKLLDFGVSKIRTVQAETPLTQTGATLGTPLYMAPEQFHNARDVDLRVDLYSASAVLYEALSGYVPFEAQSYADLVVQICCESVRPVSRVAPHLPAALGDVVMRGLAREPEDRWQSAWEFASALCAVHGGAKAATGDLRAQPFDCSVEDPTLGPSADSTRPGIADIPDIDGSAPTMMAEPGQEPAREALTSELPSHPSPPPHPVPRSFPSSPPGASPDEPKGDAAGDTMPGHFPSVPGPPSEAARTVALPETVPSAPAVDSSRSGAPDHAGRSRRWLVVVVLLAMIFGGGLIGGGVLAAWHFWGRRGEVVSNPTPATPLPPQAVTTTPGPVEPTAPPQNPNSSSTPSPGPSGDDPMGQLLTGVLGTVGEGLARQPAPPMGSDQPSGVQLYHPQLMGQLDQAAIEGALRAAQPSMAGCRQPGQPVRVRIQVQINLNQIGSMGAAPANSGPLPAVNCVAERFRGSVPQGWAPGQGGIFFFDVGLAAR